MAHPAFLRTSLASGFVADRPAAYAPEWKRLIRRLNRWIGAGYRPERHYMRGGHTPGAKSLARR